MASIRFFSVIDTWGDKITVCEECRRESDPYGMDTGYVTLSEVATPAVCDQCEFYEL